MEDPILAASLEGLTYYDDVIKMNRTWNGTEWKTWGSQGPSIVEVTTTFNVDRTSIDQYAFQLTTSIEEPTDFIVNGGLNMENSNGDGETGLIFSNIGIGNTSLYSDGFINIDGTPSLTGEAFDVTLTEYTDDPARILLDIPRVITVPAY